MKKNIYSWNLSDWINERLPNEIKEAMKNTGLNSFGIYELVKEGIAIERKKQQLHGN